jgi:AMP-binding enzyme
MTASEEMSSGNSEMLSNAPSIELSLLDVTVASPHSHNADNLTVKSRALDAAAAAKIRHLAVEAGCAYNSVYMAAWLVVQDCVLGQSQVRLNQSRENATHYSLHAVNAKSAFRALIESVEREFRRSLASPTESVAGVAALDHLWIPRGSAGKKTVISAPLNISVDVIAQSENVFRTDIVIAFSEAVFSSVMVDSLLDCMLEVLQAFAQSPPILIGDIDVLGGVGREKINVQATSVAPAQQVDSSLSIVSVFAEQVKKHGERIALTWTSEGAVQKLSYRELDHGSDAVAKKLIASGCKRDSVIAIALDRSRDAIVALLGILKIGAQIRARFFQNQFS